MDARTVLLTLVKQVRGKWQCDLPCERFSVVLANTYSSVMTQKKYFSVVMDKHSHRIYLPVYE